ncbi:hypothetical protein ALC62_08716 [Cyphomyrmex costatus]|uniref:Uncharacterized protein n=1 Tax=Cyphomyrmex costatus TaxID=456900 RepID=A0A151IGI0_9HYME|nr:hypothetical protein ALC62_08716 [Cyphomyrmex costatus]
MYTFSTCKFQSVTPSDNIPRVEELELLAAFEKDTLFRKAEDDALLYVVGSVAIKYRETLPHLGVPTSKMPPADSPDWVMTVSRGNLIHLSKVFQSAANVVEEELRKFHGNGLIKQRKMFDKITDKAMAKINASLVPQTVVHTLVRTRHYLRLKQIKIKIRERNSSKYSKLKSKKIKHITNITL